MRILFYDAACPAPYDPATMTTAAISGTHGSLVRVAEALAAWHEVVVAQEGRAAAFTSASGARYVGLDALDAASDVDAVVISRRARDVFRERARHPRARIFLWLQVMPSARYRRRGPALHKAGATIVAVSRFHQQAVEATLRSGLFTRLLRRPMPPVVRVYDPIDDDLAPEVGGPGRDPDKLVYFSSPHKGLDQVLSAFRAARERRPTLRLHVANPGYQRLSANGADGVVVLGALPQHEVLRHVREALCVFYPQTRFVETFGCIFAEANAVGTSVLAHPIGAAPEVLGNEEQLVDCRDPANVVERLMLWIEKGPPKVAARPEFRLSAVTADWRRLLETS